MPETVIAHLPDPRTPVEALLAKYGELSRINRQQVELREVIDDLLDLRAELLEQSTLGALEAQLEAEGQA